MCSAVRTSLQQQHISISISTFCYWTEQCWCRDNGTQLLGRQQQQQRPLANFFLSRLLTRSRQSSAPEKRQSRTSMCLSDCRCVCVFVEDVDVMSKRKKKTSVLSSLPLTDYLPTVCRTTAVAAAVDPVRSHTSVCARLLSDWCLI